MRACSPDHGNIRIGRIIAAGVEPIRACFGNWLTTRSLWSNTFDFKRLSAAAESTGLRLSPLESTRFVENIVEEEGTCSRSASHPSATPAAVVSMREPCLRIHRVQSQPEPNTGVVAQIKCEVERDPDETGGMKSRVHPKYKTKYRVRNWTSYERALIGRGNITIWLSRAAIAAWKPEGPRTRGAPPTYSDLAIETALTLRLLFHLPLR